MPDLTAESLRELLDYDPETGVFRWRVGRRGSARAGSVAGNVSKNGYRRILFAGQKRYAHRLAWLYVHGRLPVDGIDHINGERADNRLCNLREATRAENNQNKRRAHRSNKSCGLLGVTWYPKIAKWYAGITLNGKKHSLGFYATAEDAHAAYVKAKAVLHPFSGKIHSSQPQC